MPHADRVHALLNKVNFLPSKFKKIMINDFNYNIRLSYSLNYELNTMDRDKKFMRCATNYIVFCACSNRLNKIVNIMQKVTAT